MVPAESLIYEKNIILLSAVPAFIGKGTMAYAW